MGQMCQIFVRSIKWKEISHSAGAADSIHIQHFILNVV